MASLTAVFAWLAFPALAGSLATSDEIRDDLFRKGKALPADAIWLDSLDISKVVQSWGKPRANASVEGNPIRLGGVEYPRGVGTHSVSEMRVNLKGSAREFAAMVGVDDEVEEGSVVFVVWVDGRKAADSGTVEHGQLGKLISADLRGAKMMTLAVESAEDGIDFDHADWAGAVIFLEPGAKEKPEAVDVAAFVDEPPPPISAVSPAEPAIHGPRIVGATPGRPFLFLVPAIGEGPLVFSARNLPPGLVLEEKTGIIRGRIVKAGKSVVRLEVRGSRGKASRNLTILAGEHRLALTPPMGWNSWNAWGTSIDDKKVREAAEWMVRSGLAAHGYQYVNIDDAWEGGRDPAGRLGTNEKFPDMKALADYVHSLGLKIGIYSSPGPKTCAGYEGSLGHEETDARTWAEWGIDYLKYDWCSYKAPEWNRKELRKPYEVMRAALDRVDRDIVFSLCQYGMENVWEWGADVGGNLWRTTGDITDSWASLSGIGFSQDSIAGYGGPGHWNDPDMLVVGMVGWGPKLRQSRLTRNEQITHITLWSLLAAPMLIGCDLARLDDFTLALLTNDDVLDVNQDPLGKAATKVLRSQWTEVWKRPLWDGTYAVGLFNRGPEAESVEAKFSDLGLKGKLPVRDLWLKKDLGVYKDGFSARVPAHGAMLLKVGRPRLRD